MLVLAINKHKLQHDESMKSVYFLKLSTLMIIPTFFLLILLLLLLLLLELTNLYSIYFSQLELKIRLL